MSALVVLVVLVVMTKSIIAQNTSVCVWGRDTKPNLAVINGEFIFQGMFNGSPWYKKQYGTYIGYLFNCNTKYCISPNEPEIDAISTSAICATSTSYPHECDEWQIHEYGGLQIDHDVFCETGPCPEWNCDQIITNINYEGCNDTFAMKIDTNIYSNQKGNRFFYFDYLGFNWICNNEVIYKSSISTSLAFAERKWLDISMGNTVDIHFTTPFNDTQEIQCLQHPTNEPTQQPTAEPSDSPTKHPATTIDPTISPLTTSTINTVTTKLITKMPTNLKQTVTISTTMKVTTREATKAIVVFVPTANETVAQSQEGIETTLMKKETSINNVAAIKVDTIIIIGVVLLLTLAVFIGIIIQFKKRKQLKKNMELVVVNVNASVNNHDDVEEVKVDKELLEVIDPTVKNIVVETKDDSKSGEQREIFNDNDMKTAEHVLQLSENSKYNERQSNNTTLGAPVSINTQLVLRGSAIMTRGQSAKHKMAEYSDANNGSVNDVNLNQNKTKSGAHVYINTKAVMNDSAIMTRKQPAKHRVFGEENSSNIKIAQAFNPYQQRQQEKNENRVRIDEEINNVIK